MPQVPFSSWLPASCYAPPAFPSGTHHRTSYWPQIANWLYLFTPSALQLPPCNPPIVYSDFGSSFTRSCPSSFEPRPCKMTDNDAIHIVSGVPSSLSMGFPAVFIVSNLLISRKREWWLKWGKAAFVQLLTKVKKHPSHIFQCLVTHLFLLILFPKMITIKSHLHNNTPLITYCAWCLPEATRDGITAPSSSCVLFVHFALEWSAGWLSI